MKGLKPKLERYWYQEAVFRIANAARALLRAMLLLVGLTICIVCFFAIGSILMLRNIPSH